jgi:NAD(P)-dependent dehydrogenase (short-subunit alcohol dehydrogenase family)
MTTQSGAALGEPAGLAGPVAVTGAASGIGLGVARALVAAGTQVILLDIAPAALDAASRELGMPGRVLDVSSVRDVREVFADLPPLGGLVTSAGVSELAPIASMTSAHRRRITGVQLDGTSYCLQAAARNIVAHGRGGSVVFVGSVNGRFGHRGHSAYGAAKADVEMLARAAALEFAGAGIRVNAVAPGIVESGMTAAVLADDDFVGRWSAAIPLGRFGRLDDIADVITFLLSRPATGSPGRSSRSTVVPACGSSPRSARTRTGRSRQYSARSPLMGPGTRNRPDCRPDTRSRARVADPVAYGSGTPVSELERDGFRQGMVLHAKVCYL